ncbi:hypothetical protein [Erythrobacter sp.]|jgi:hypothetical protein|uniref:hypothetical protein n=1 Tax=Erythrobacter sp. TaxID=1042 RepID=UPI002EC0D7B3|nr:hypothetical protein [Erythrobacter sp.]
MGQTSIERSDTRKVDAVLRDQLARETRALVGVAPVVAHMLDAEGSALVSEEIVARLRGMIDDIARQCVAATGSEADEPCEVLAAVLAADEALLGHLFAAALEGQLTSALEARSNIDPVLSPLLQELIASQHPSTADLAMTTLAAQSRFCQSQRRMDLALGELPHEAFLRVLSCFENAPTGLELEMFARAIARLKRDYDEAQSRIGLCARLILAMREGAVAALDLDHAGLALFTTALASYSKQPRDLAVVSCHPGQSARLALALRMAGRDGEEIERQFLALGMDASVSGAIETLSPARAGVLLSGRTDTAEAGGARPG